MMPIPDAIIEKLEIPNTENSNPANFANERDKASKVGHKGGQASGENFTNDHEKASQADKKVSQNSHGGNVSD